MIAGKAAAAAVSVISNSLLIGLKLFAGIVTGSIAILTDAIHSLVDLLSSVVAFVSVRKADEPVDESHPYGHEKAENVAAGAEAMLILLGAGIVTYEATRRLAVGSEIEAVGLGLAAIGTAALVNLAVSAFLFKRAREHESPALEGDAQHLRADAATSIAVLAGLALVELTGAVAFDSIAALVVAAAIVYAGVRLLMRSGRVLMDEALPADELDLIEAAIEASRPPEMAGYHKLRGRRAGARRHVDLHVQFRGGTALEDAHRLAHRVRDAIQEALPAADVLIHLEPESSVADPDEAGPLRAG